MEQSKKHIDMIEVLNTDFDGGINEKINFHISRFSRSVMSNSLRPHGL